MVRDAKLYILSYKDWKPLTEMNLKPSLITIYQLYSFDSIGQEYAIISLSDEINKAVEKHGAEEAGEFNQLRTSLHDYHGEPLYGDKENVIYLKKL